MEKPIIHYLLNWKVYDTTEFNSLKLDFQKKLLRATDCSSPVVLYKKKEMRHLTFLPVIQAENCFYRELICLPLLLHTFLVILQK